MHAANDRIQIIKDLFKAQYKTSATQVTPLPPSGSPRLYYRVSDDEGHTAIGTYNYNVAENNSFFYFTELLRKHQINVAEIYQISADHKYYLQQDLGDTSLFDLLQQKGHVTEVKNWYKQALLQLAKFQWVAGRDVDFQQCFGTKRFDEHAIAADMQYFKYYFADLQQTVYNKEQVQEDIGAFSKALGGVQPQMLMYRDFQSRNIFIHDDKVWFIDFQGAMQGAPQYDIASLLWQAKAQLPQAWKDELLNTYILGLENLSVRIDNIYFRKAYNQFVLLRMMQTMGAYGFRGIIEKKPHFLSSIGPALVQMKQFLEDHPHQPEYPELRHLLEQVTISEVIEKYQQPTYDNPAQLKVDVCSFAYKNGYPQNTSGHGGGYVFDCRGILNPGRKEAYKKMTGLDNEVQQYLINDTQMPAFLEHTQQLLSLSVKEYLERGFEHLSVAFGCTGGQHRSVFAAEQMAAFLQKQFNVTVTLNHLNKANWVQ